MAIRQLRLGVVGQRFHPGADKKLAETPIGTAIDLVREPENKYDPNAVAVHIDGQHCGFIWPPKAQAVRLAANIDGGSVHAATLGGKNLVLVDVEVGDDEPTQEEEPRGDKYL